MTRSGVSSEKGTTNRSLPSRQYGHSIVHRIQGARCALQADAPSRHRYRDHQHVAQCARLLQVADVPG